MYLTFTNRFIAIIFLIIAAMGICSCKDRSPNNTFNPKPAVVDQTINSIKLTVQDTILYFNDF